MNKPSESGFSLIELLFGIALSFLFLHLLFQSYIFFSKQSDFLKESIQLEENAHFAQFILTREIQTAGFLGCNQWNNVTIHSHLKEIGVPLNPIQIFDKNSQFLGNRIHPESDILVIQKMSETTDCISRDLKTKSLKINANRLFKKEDALIIADCEKADFIYPTAIKPSTFFQTITLPQPLIYPAGAQIGKFVATAFFIEKTHRKNLRGNAVYALYAYDLINHQKTEYLSGVNKMLFSYATVNENENNPVFKPFLASSEFFLTDEKPATLLLKIILHLSSENFDRYAPHKLCKKITLLIFLRNMSIM